MVQKSGRNITEKWEQLIGPMNEFSKANRSVNAVLVISFALMMLNIPINIALNLVVSNLISIGFSIIIFILYYLSRYRKAYRTSMTLYGVISYIGLIANYWYNSGIDGPTTFLFFLTFQLIIAMTPRKQHLIWVSLHLITVIALLTLEYTNPSLKLSTYPDRESRFTDTIFTYIFSIIFIYFITAYLLNSYIKEKKLAKERADAIQSQNEILKDIAWMQSHKIRSHVATIMGLTDILESHPDDPDNKNIIKNIKSVAHDLDHVIRDINDLTNEKP